VVVVADGSVVPPSGMVVVTEVGVALVVDDGTVMASAAVVPVPPTRPFPPANRLTATATAVAARMTPAATHRVRFGR
jgi:hypothetical protein